MTDLRGDPGPARTTRDCPEWPHARGETVTTHLEDIIRQNSQRLDDLKKTTEDVQRELSEARVSLERELARSPQGHAAPTEQIREYRGPAREPFSVPPPAPAQGQGQGQGHYVEDPLPYYAQDSRPYYPVEEPPYYAVDEPPYYAADEPPYVGEGPSFETGAAAGQARAPAGEFVAVGPLAPDRPAFAGAAVHGPAVRGAAIGSRDFEHPDLDSLSADPAPPGAGYAHSVSGDSDPTAGIVSHGRQSAYRRRLSRRSLIAITAAAVVLVTVLAVLITSGGASWPSSVATVQAEVLKACQNPDVVSEPGQVNFACAKATRQILWVFALLTSNDNPRFSDTKTARQGLEPITPGQGGVVASSLNLHHPYDPANPIDSIAVAARAINDIIGGATLTGTNGNPVVQPGLESHSANCLRYTGSGVVTSRQGFPGLCAAPVTGAHGQMELVADIYRKWIVGASGRAAHEAAVLFANADNPGNPQVQAILRTLGNETLAA